MLKQILIYGPRLRTCRLINSFPASGDFCCLLTTFANSLDPDQARHVGPDLDPNCLIVMVFLKVFFLEKGNFEKSSRRQKACKNYSACKELIHLPQQPCDQSTYTCTFTEIQDPEVQNTGSLTKKIRER